MNRIFLWPAALLALAAAAVGATAQPATPSGLPTTPGAPADMREDVEVFRRLLDGALGEVYGAKAHNVPTPPMFGFGQPAPLQTNNAYRNIATEAVHLQPQSEGVYLKDFGVLYSVTLPATGFDPALPSVPGAAGRPQPDAWDRVRKEVRGETPAPAAPAVPAHRPLSEVILKLLAENGRHFAGLPENERVAVAVTFRGEVNCAACHANPWGGNQPLPLATFENRWGASQPPRAVTAEAAPAVPPAGTSPGQTTTAPDAPQYLLDARGGVLLGDLHAKQGKTEEAVDAYLKAATQLDKAIDSHRRREVGLRRDDVPTLLAMVDVCNKLAGLYVQTEKPEAAVSAIQKAGELAKEAENLTGHHTTVNPTPPAPSAVPAKLVVTASKKLLDEVGSGKTTFEAFCKAATVEYDAPPAGKKSTTP